MVKISVIMPIYNVSDYLNKSIGSIQNQTMDDLEIICVDDGSTDDSVDVLEKLQKKYSNITIISQENSGPGCARNNGILHANGDYIAFLDGDDIFLDENALEKMYLTAKENDFCPLICANLRRINQDYSLDEYYDYLNSKFNYFLKEDVVDVESYGIPFAFYKNIFNRNFLLNNNILFPDYRFGEDPLFMVDVLEKIDSFPVVPVDLYGYNHSIGGGVNEKITTYEKKYEYIKNFKSVFDKLIQNNYKHILSGYKNEFINYLVYSNNMLDVEIREIIKDLFSDYVNYFEVNDYGFFLMDYLINYEESNASANEKEYVLIKKYLFEESCIEGNFIGINRLRDFEQILSDKYVTKNNNLNFRSYNQIGKILSDSTERLNNLNEELDLLNNKVKYEMFDKKADDLKKFIESRIDIKNYGKFDNDIEIVECSDSTCHITNPSWFTDDEGRGSVLTSVKGNLKLKIKCIHDGKLVIDFKSIDYKDKDGNRIPIYIDYYDILIDNNKVIENSFISWHDEPFTYETNVKHNDEVTVELKWLPLNNFSNIHLHSDSNSLLSKFLECRIDLKNYGSFNNDIKILDSSDFSCNISKPTWFKDDNGTGYMVNSIAGNLNMTFECINDGKLVFEFRGIDCLDKKDNRIPIFINYTDIKIDGNQIINENITTWHDEPFVFKKNVKDGQTINLQVSWLPLNNVEDNGSLFTKEDVSYMKNMIHDKNNEINKLRKEFNSLEQENIVLKNFKTNVLNSNSWKLTKPLRKIKNKK